MSPDVLLFQGNRLSSPSRYCRPHLKSNLPTSSKSTTMELLSSVCKAFAVTLSSPGIIASFAAAMLLLIVVYCHCRTYAKPALQSMLPRTPSSRFHLP